MKVFWIVLAVVFGCGIICCGGFFLVFKGAYQAGVKTTAEGDEYALASVNAICKTWDETAIKQRLAPTASTSLAFDLVAEGKKLGPLQEAGPFTAENFSANTNDSSRVLATDSATFKNGTATLKLALVKSGGIWQIQDFTVISSALSTSDK